MSNRIYPGQVSLTSSHNALRSKVIELGITLTIFQSLAGFPYILHHFPSFAT
jgi:hypothetical protein